MANPPAVFISYAHESSNLKDAVLRLSNRLRREGIAAVIDRYVLAPPEGWPIWTERRIRESDFVLLVCTEEYLRRIERRQEGDVGRGVVWEATLIHTDLYEERVESQKYVPIGFAPTDHHFVPRPLRGHEFFDVSDQGGYERLYRLLTGRPEVVPPEVGALRALPQLTDAQDVIEAKVEAHLSNLRADHTPPDYFFLNHTSFLRKDAQEQLRRQTGYPGDVYDIRVIVDSFDSGAMQKIDRVRYDLGAGWPQPVQERADAANHFLLKELAFAPPLLKADIFLKDSDAPVTLYRYLTLWTSGPRLSPARNS